MFKYVIKCGEKHDCSKIFEEKVNTYLSTYLEISKNHNEIINLLLSKKKPNFYFYNRIFNLCEFEIKNINYMNNKLKEKNIVYISYNNNINNNDNIKNSNNFLKKKNNYEDIKYYIYNIYLTFIIKKNYKNLWIYKYVNSNIIYDIFMHYFNNFIKGLEENNFKYIYDITSNNNIK
jgi:hypothetical protein